MDTSQPVDLFHQNVNVVLPDGSNVSVSMDDLNDFVTYGIRVNINYGTQIGASVILLVVLLLLTKEDKRKAPVFILNAISLAFNIIRTVMQSLYFTGAFYYPYAYLPQDYGRVPQTEYNISIAGTIFSTFLLICIEISLVLQTRVVCVLLKRAYRFWITVLSASVALIAIGIRFALMVINIRYVKAAENFSSYHWLAKGSLIAITVSICFFSVIFSLKLGYACYQRRKLGLRSFGPMQIIFVMGCQTMIVPALFCILQFFSEAPELGSQVLTIVAIFLPLSSMWAASSINGKNQASNGPDAHRKLFGSYRSSTDAGRSDKSSTRKPFFGSLNNNSTRISHSPLPSPKKVTMDSIDRDLEAQGLNIRMKQSFDVTNEKA